MAHVGGWELGRPGNERVVWLARAGVRGLTITGFDGALSDVDRILAVDPQDFAARGGRALLLLLKRDLSQILIIQGLARERPEEFQELLEGLPEPSQRLVLAAIGKLPPRGR